MTSPALLLAAIANVAALRQAVWSDASEGESFSVTCTVTAVARTGSRHTSYWVVDETGYGYMRATNAIVIAVGDRIAARGHVGADVFDWQRAFLENAARLGRGEVPPPAPASPEQLSDETFDGRTVVMRGIVTDIVHDEIDPAWRFLLMRTDSTPFFAAVCSDDDGADMQRLSEYIDAHPDVTAFLAAEFGIAVMLYTVLANKGLKDKKEIAFFDGYDEDVNIFPKYPHIIQNQYQMGVTAVSSLVHMLRGEKVPAKVVIPHFLVS